MGVEELLAAHAIDPTGLPAAPAAPTSRDVRARICTLPLQPCAVCGEDGATARILHANGPRWLDLCWNHSKTVMQPAPGIPDTMEGILADLREAAAEAGMQLRLIGEDEWTEMSRRARRLS